MKLRPTERACLVFLHHAGTRRSMQLPEALLQLADAIAATGQSDDSSWPTTPRSRNQRLGSLSLANAASKPLQAALVVVAVGERRFGHELVAPAPLLFVRGKVWGESA